MATLNLCAVMNPVDGQRLAFCAYFHDKALLGKFLVEFHNLIKPDTAPTKDI